MTTKNNPKRAEIFKQLKALFEFDKKGVLQPMARGMAGPIGLPMGYMDMSNVMVDNQPLKGHLVLTWSKEEEALIVLSGSNKRAATDEELEYALNHYAQAIKDFREEMITLHTKDGKKLSQYFQSRLGLIPYFQNNSF